MDYEAETEAKDSLLLRLTPQQYAVTQMGATEPPFTGQFWDHHERGTYRCVCCGEPVFHSEAKYDSGSGWPSFSRPLSEDRIDSRLDNSQGMDRTEVRCKKCGAHLGHVFDDGPAPEGNRYCINSLALDFEPMAEGEQEPRSVDG